MVECADRLAALYWHRAASRAVVAIAIFIGFLVVGIRLGYPSMGVGGLLFAAALIVLPHILRLRRFLTSLECRYCHKPAGRYFTRESRVFLRCQHCGEESATDCILAYAGGPPAKG